jgi:hypothetical protein
MPPVLEGNVYIRVVTVTALPPAVDYPNVFAVYSGKLYWSDGATWHQVAPPTSGAGGGGGEGGELVIGIITD